MPDTDLVKPTSQETHARGEARGNAKLTAAQVLAIRKLATSGVKTAEIAARFGVARPTIWSLLHGRSWRSVPELTTRKEN